MTITRVFVGPQFVKSASESEVALDREAVLTVENVSKTFTQRRGTKVTRTEAVKNASFVLHRGGVTALVGQSGSGKSTLARMITGVDRPTSGTITFHGSKGDVVVGAIVGFILLWEAWTSRGGRQIIPAPSAIVRALFEEAQDRLHAMARVHDLLSKSESVYSYPVHRCTFSSNSVTLAATSG